MLIAWFSLVLLMFSACCPGIVQPAHTTLAVRQSPVLVEVFYTAGCNECREIEDEILPNLQELMGESIDLRKYDILESTNYLHLAMLHAKSGVQTTERVSIYVDERIHLGGLKTIKAQLIPTVEAASLQKTEVRGQRSEISMPGELPDEALAKQRRQTTDDRGQTSDTRHQTTELSSKRPTSNIEHRTSNADWILAAQRQTTDEGTEKQTSNAQHRTPNIERLKSEGKTTGKPIFEERLENWSIPAIALAGLIDGLNPCAFTTIIFFITLLAATGKRGKELIAVGIGFCTAVFLTYFLLGFGFFHVIQKLTAFHRAGEALRWAMVAILAVFCLVSFKDALAFRKTGQARAVILQLPDTIRKRIHDIMRTRMTPHRLLLGSFIVGGLVTLLESVCTGQFYVPTLVYLSRHAGVGRQALGLLTLYNLMFVIPHVAVFVAAYRGVTNERLLAWSRSNAVWSKILLGLGFAALAGLLVWL